MKPITAKEARNMMAQALENYDMNGLKNTVINEIRNAAGRGADKIYHKFDEVVPDNAKKALCDWLTELGYDANMPVADKTKIRVCWRG